MKIFYCLMGLLCLLQKLPAQDNNIKPLTLGDAAPVILLNNVYNNSSPTIDIANRNGKPLLIDFWASWCGSCIGLMPKLEAYRQQFAGQLEMLSVNIEPADTKDKINAFWKRRQEQTGLEMKMPYVLQDSLLQRYFPPASIPQLVWIDSSGRVAAISDAEALSDSNLQKFVNNLPLDKLLPPRIGFDALNTAGNVFDCKMIYRNSLAEENTRLKEGITFTTDSNGNRDGYYAINISLMQLLQVAYPAVMQHGRESVIYEGDKKDLQVKYCYELRGTNLSEKNIQLQLRLALKNALHITAYSANRKIPCAVLSSIQKSPSRVVIQAKSEYDLEKLSLHKRLVNQPPRSLLVLLNKWYPIPVLEETKLANITLHLPFDIYAYSKTQLLTFLKTNGLVVTETERVLPVAVIKNIP